MSADRIPLLFILALSLLAVIWVFSVTRPASGLSRKTIFRVRGLAVCFWVLSCFLIIPSLRTVPVNPQLFQNDNCQISCWNGVTVGKTNVDDLREILQAQYRHVEENESHVWSNDGDWRIFDIQTDDGMQIHIDTKGGFVSQIALTANTFSLSLNDMLHLLGQTNFATVYDVPEMVGNILGETMVENRSITIFYPDSGYILTAALPSQSSKHRCISGDELINAIQIVEAGTIDQLLAHLDSPPVAVPYPTNNWQNDLLKNLKPLSAFACSTT